MEAIVAYVKKEPVVVLTAVKALLAVLVVFGLPIPDGLDVALAGLVVAVLTVLTRGLVTPTPPDETPVDENGDPLPAEEEEDVEPAASEDAPEDATSAES